MESPAIRSYRFANAYACLSKNDTTAIRAIFHGLTNKKKSISTSPQKAANNKQEN